MLKRFATMMGVVALVGIAGLAGAQDEKAPTIKQAMAKLHKGGTAALPSVRAALKTGTPDWKKVQVTTKLIADLSAAITELEPPKGDKANYTKLSKDYATNAASLKVAAEKEDLPKAKESADKLGSSCMPCHKAHRPS